MVSLQPVFWKAYWTLAGVGIAWGVFVLALCVPWVQRNALYAHKFQTGLWGNVSVPEEFGFAKGQVQPFWLETSDKERLFCWHVLPLDVYLENELELATAAASGEVVEELKGTVGEKLLRRDPESRVVVNFHGNAGHVAQGHRPSTYRSISGIPHTHLLTCDYRGFGLSSLNNPPHLPTETGLINDAISLLSYIRTTLNHPPSRTVLLGQSLGTAVTAASALYFTHPDSKHLPHDLTHPVPLTPSKPPPPSPFAGIILVSPFTDLPTLLKTYKIGGLLPVLKPLRGYPRIAHWITLRILDPWPTLARLDALVAASLAAGPAPHLHSHLHLHILHARNDQAIDWTHAERVFQPLATRLLSLENAHVREERRSIHGGERVTRGAFAYKRVEDGRGARTLELEVVRFGGHNEVVGWAPVGLAVRRAFERRSLRPGLDVE
ncbi:hypothetical protein ACN47E_000541 [Coniothyrium glycines]